MFDLALLPQNGAGDSIGDEFGSPRGREEHRGKQSTA